MQHWFYDYKIKQAKLRHFGFNTGREHDLYSQQTDLQHHYYPHLLKEASLLQCLPVFGPFLLSVCTTVTLTGCTSQTEEKEIWGDRRVWSPTTATQTQTTSGLKSGSTNQQVTPWLHSKSLFQMSTPAINTLNNSVRVQAVNMIV